MENVSYISDIGIDSSGKLYIKPDTEKFDLIWRSATEVQWDLNNGYLYSPKPREWTYFKWYKHIVSTIEIEYNRKLKITTKTKWNLIGDDLKNEIVVFDENF
jgi:hypothetical protein